jgi:hypothetical protein
VKAYRRNGYITKWCEGHLHLFYDGCISDIYCSVTHVLYHFSYFEVSLVLTCHKQMFFLLLIEFRFLDFFLLQDRQGISPQNVHWCVIDL